MGKMYDEGRGMVMPFIFDTKHRQQIEENEPLEGFVKAQTLSIKSFGIRTGSEFDDVKFCVLDDEYDTWLGRRDNDFRHKKEYCDQLSENDALRLLKKNHFDTQDLVLALPVYVAFDKPLDECHYKTSFRLDEQSEKDFLEYADIIFSKENVFLPGYIFSANEMQRSKKTVQGLRDIARTWFDNKKRIRYGVWEEQDLSVYAGSEYFEDNVCIYTYYIPFVVRGKFDSAFLSKLGDTDPMEKRRLFGFDAVFDSDWFEEEGLTGIPEINESAFARDLKTVFGGREVDIDPEVILACRVCDYDDGFQKEESESRTIYANAADSMPYKQRKRAYSMIQKILNLPGDKTVHVLGRTEYQFFVPPIAAIAGKAEEGHVKEYVEAIASDYLSRLIIAFTKMYFEYGLIFLQAHDPEKDETTIYEFDIAKGMVRATPADEVPLAAEHFLDLEEPFSVGILKP